MALKSFGNRCYTLDIRREYRGIYLANRFCRCIITTELDDIVPTGNNKGSLLKQAESKLVCFDPQPDLDNANGGKYC